MGNFNQRGNKFGGKKSFGGGGGGFGGGRDHDRGDRPQMFSATCAECGKECQVPFKPNGSKPVYCSDCFGKKSSSDRPHSDRPRFDAKPSFRPAQVDQYRKEFESLNSKLDDILRMLNTKPVTVNAEKVKKVVEKKVIKKVVKKKK